MNVHLTLQSKNAKTGPIPVSTTSGETCPGSCPFNSANEGGCYAGSGPLALHWKAVSQGKRGTTWAGFTQQIGQLPAGTFWRHNQAGDLPGDGETIDAQALDELVAANKGKRGFTYTHYPMTQGNAAAVAKANASGFTINLSANDLGDADRLASLNVGPVVVVMPAATDGKTAKTPAGRTVVVCPATYRDDVSCSSCQLCQRGRDAIVGFPAHGSSKAKADKIARRMIPIAVAA